MATTARSRRTQADSTSLDEPALRVLRSFRLVFNAVKSHFREVEKKAGVAGAQVWALSVIQTSPGIGVGDLAGAMDIHQSTASNLLRSLIEAELVEASRAEEDRRALRLALTAKGARVLRKAPGPFAGVLPEALQSLDHRTLQRLERDLESLILALKPDQRGAKIPLGQPDK